MPAGVEVCCELAHGGEWESVLEVIYFCCVSCFVSYMSRDKFCQDMRKTAEVSSFGVVVVLEWDIHVTHRLTNHFRNHAIRCVVQHIEIIHILHTCHVRPPNITGFYLRNTQVWGCVLKAANPI